MIEKIYSFVEPHITGGYCKVTITTTQILNFMHGIQRKEPRYAGATDTELINEFCTIHWCKEET